MDSDGDGITNGQELGDPDCVWTPESTPSITDGVTHPGQNCQPVTPAPTPAPTPPSDAQCEVAESDRNECGFYGIDEPGCLNNGCCWRSSGIQGVPWCFQGVQTLRSSSFNQDVGKQPRKASRHGFLKTE